MPGTVLLLQTIHQSCCVAVAKQCCGWKTGLVGQAISQLANEVHHLRSKHESSVEIVSSVVVLTPHSRQIEVYMIDSRKSGSHDHLDLLSGQTL